MPADETLPIALVVRAPNQPRKHFDPAGLAELAASVRAFGLLQPIVVRPAGDGRWWIVMGERRWRACRMAGLETVPVRRLPAISDQHAFELALAENINRADMRPSEEAAAYATLVAAGRSVAEVAALYGKTARWVQMFVDLLDLIPDALAMTDAKTLPLQVAWTTSRLAAAGQQTVLGKWVRGEFTDARDAAAFATACRHAEDQLTLIVDDQDEPAKQHQAVARRRLVTRIERLGEAGAILAELAATDEHELARLLSGARGGVHVYRERVRAIDQAASKALAQLRKAAAIAAAATLPITPGLLDEPAPRTPAGPARSMPVT